MSERTPVAAGNWKMNTTPAQGVALCEELIQERIAASGAEVIVFPPFTHLAEVRDVLAGSGIALGAQNLFWEPSGAFTGEVSAVMIRALATHVLIGHSERRQYFGETDETVQRKLVAALAAGLIPMVCVGESLAERDSGVTEAVLERQLRGALHGVVFGAELILAYEPVWAIGTGRAATPEQANAAMAFIRGVAGSETSSDLASRIRVLYGGSVTADNAAEFIAGPDVDGALVGGASLKAESFAAIARAIRATASR